MFSGVQYHPRQVLLDKRDNESILNLLRTVLIEYLVICVDLL